jgi:hypothetical protein
VTPSLPTRGAYAIVADKIIGGRLRQIKAAVDEMNHGNANDRLIQQDNAT